VQDDLFNGRSHLELQAHIKRTGTTIRMSILLSPLVISLIFFATISSHWCNCFGQRLISWRGHSFHWVKVAF
jgi:hypothetical protein